MLDRHFAPASVDSLFSDAALLAAMARFEGGLAQAQATVGLVPTAAAQAIARACNELGDPAASDRSDQALADGAFDPARLYPAARTAGSLVAPFLKALAGQVAHHDPQAVRYLHQGASHQDVLDSALAMQCKEAGRRVTDALERTGNALCGQIGNHADTMMMGRVLLQPAGTMPFAWKLAGWLDPLTRSRRHLRAALLDAAVLQFGGNIGTLAAHGTDTARTQSIARRLGDSLGLLVPAASWHGARDRFARVGAELGVLCGAIGKVGRDIALLMQPEIAEVFEPEALGRGDAEAALHKRDPVGAVLMRDAALRVPGLVGTLISAMDIEHERGLGQWQSTWWTMRQLFGAAASALAAAEDVIGGLQVNSDGMQANIDRMQGFVASEAVAAQIAPKLGQAEARALVAELGKLAMQRGWTLRQALGRDTRIAAVMNLGDLDRLFDAGAQRGASSAMIDQVVAAWQSSR